MDACDKCRYSRTHCDGDDHICDDYAPHRIDLWFTLWLLLGATLLLLGVTFCLQKGVELLRML